MNNFLFAETVSVNNFLFEETVSVNNFLFAETVSVNNLFLKGKREKKALEFYLNICQIMIVVFEYQVFLSGSTTITKVHVC